MIYSRARCCGSIDHQFYLIAILTAFLGGDMYLGQQWRTFSLGSIAGIRASVPPEYKVCWTLQPVRLFIAGCLFVPTVALGENAQRDVSWAGGRLICVIMSIFACKLSMVCPYGCHPDRSVRGRWTS